MTNLGWRGVAPQFMNLKSCLRLLTNFYDDSLDFTGLGPYTCSMNSERTQIARKTTSAPMRWIVDNVYLSKFGDVLHFGEGKAFKDTAALERSGSRAFAYDPGSPDIVKRDRSIIDPARGMYAVGVSIYVFNTLLPSERVDAFWDMLSCCQRCVIAVRTDKVEGTPHPLTPGVITKRGTFQTQLNADQWQAWFLRVSPEWASVDVLHKTSAYVIIGVKR